MPIGMVRTATEERVVLIQKIEDLHQLPPFEETHFVLSFGRDTVNFLYGLLSMSQILLLVRLWQKHFPEVFHCHTAGIGSCSLDRCFVIAIESTLVIITC